jgi:hypothetical protein
MRRGTGASLLAAGALAAALGGCGEKEEPEVRPPPRPPERSERVPKLPSAWTEAGNEEQGFALGVPPGWKRGRDCLPHGRRPGATTVLCSPDKLVTLSVSADRSDEALELAPGAFAVRATKRLGEERYPRGLEAGRPRRFGTHYNGVVVRAQGKAATGVEQDVSVVVLRRAGIANFTAVIAANAGKPTGPAVGLAERGLRSLRSQPPRAGPRAAPDQRSGRSG